MHSLRCFEVHRYAPQKNIAIFSFAVFFLLLLFKNSDIVAVRLLWFRMQAPLKQFLKIRQFEFAGMLLGKPKKKIVHVCVILSLKC